MLQLMRESREIADKLKEIRVPLSKLLEKAREMQIFSLNDFINADIFHSNYVLKGEMIVKEL